jgi:hypothetical protein
MNTYCPNPNCGVAVPHRHTAVQNPDGSWGSTTIGYGFPLPPPPPPVPSLVRHLRFAAMSRIENMTSLEELAAALDTVENLRDRIRDREFAIRQELRRGLRESVDRLAAVEDVEGLQ